MAETAEDRQKRMRMRSWRRGMKEMDLILGPFSDAQLQELSPGDLELYDALLSENDQDLLRWMMGQAAAPDRFAQIVARIAAFAHGRLAQRN